MKTIHKKMLFVAIVGIASGLTNLILFTKFGHSNPPWLSYTLFLPAALHFGSVLSFPCKHHIKIPTAFFVIAVSHLSLLFAMFLPNSPEFLSELADLYAPFGTTFSALISMYFHKNAQCIQPEEVRRCSVCGAIHHKYSAFCPRCQTLSPLVQKTIDRFPNKRPLDFTPDLHRHLFCCPHCGIVYREDKSGRSTEITAIELGTPLRACRNCHWFSIDPQYGEWFFMSKSDRFRYLFHIDLYVASCFLSVVVVCSEYEITLLTVTAFSFAILFAAIWTHIRLHDEIKASYQRAKRNPNYPHILKHMGYENFISKTISLKRKS